MANSKKKQATKKKTRKPDLDAVIRKWLVAQRINRPNYRTAQRALRYSKDDLHDAQRTLKWLRARPWYDEESAVAQALITIEEKAQADIDRIHPFSRGEQQRPAVWTPLLVTLTKIMHPQGVPKKEVLPHSRELVKLLAKHGIKRQRADSISQLLRTYHHRYPLKRLFK